MVSETQIPQESIVLKDVAQQGLQTGFILEDTIAVQKTLVQFDDLA